MSLQNLKKLIGKMVFIGKILVGEQLKKNENNKW